MMAAMIVHVADPFGPGKKALSSLLSSYRIGYQKVSYLMKGRKVNGELCTRMLACYQRCIYLCLCNVSTTTL